MPRQLSKGWLDSFVDYTYEMECPRDWLLWAGISAISSTLKRNCYVDYRRIKFYPSQYIILVGPPGIGKGESISVATSICKQAKLVNYLKDWHTPQEILEQLSEGFGAVNLKLGQVVTSTVVKDHTCCILAAELATLFQNNDKLHSLFCSLWDQDEFSYGTKNKGKYDIKEMSVSLLGGTVPDYIRSFFKENIAAITGGFTARTIFVYAKEKFQLNDSFFHYNTNHANLIKLKNELVNDLSHISTLKGEITLDSGAENYWKTKYTEHNTRKDFNSDASTNFNSRISSHIIKTAITISVSESDSLTITEDHLRRATSYIEGVRDNVDIVFRSVGESPIAVIQDKALQYIERQGIVSYTGLRKYMYRDATDDQLNQVVMMLKTVGLIKESINSTGGITYESTNTVTVPNPHKP